MKWGSDPEQDESLKKENDEPRSGDFLSGLGLDVRRKNLVIIACAGWESGKPFCGFPLFHAAYAGAVEMWKSRRVCEISKGRWKGWKTCLWFSRLSTAPPFPRPSGIARIGAAWAIRFCTAAADAPWPRSSAGRKRCRSFVPLPGLRRQNFAPA